MISIIIPAYNLEKYIAQCLDSILEQTYTDYEVIVVNDGSKDGTLPVLRKYESLFPANRYTVLEKPNGGVTAARRDGYLAAKGEWISFVDGDDMLLPNSLENLAAEIKPEINAVCGSFEEFKDGQSDFQYFSIKVPAGIYSSVDVMRFMMTRRFYTGPWGKLYRRSRMSVEMFDLPREITNKEDTIFNYRYFAHANGKVAMTFKPIYRYRVERAGSAFFAMYSSKNMTLDYEFKVLYYLDSVITELPSFSVSNQDALSVRNFNMLWGWRRLYKQMTQTQFTKVWHLFQSVRFHHILPLGYKGVFKYILLSSTLYKYKCLWIKTS